MSPPLEVFNIASSGLPVYGLEAGPPKTGQPMNISTFTPVRTIFDTGAESNYITARKAQVTGAQIYPISAQEIVGAGRTITNAFAVFTLRIGGLSTPCYAYVLEDASQFRYALPL